jgi:hypothetical protein
MYAVWNIASDERDGARRGWPFGQLVYESDHLLEGALEGRPMFQV